MNRNWFAFNSCLNNFNKLIEKKQQQKQQSVWLNIEPFFVMLTDRDQIFKLISQNVTYILFYLINYWSDLFR